MSSKLIGGSSGFPEGDAFLEYWTTLPRIGGSPAPAKIAFNPSHVKPLLPHIFVAEKMSDDKYTVRLRGTWLEQFVGYADKSNNVYDAYSGKSRDNYKTFINTLLSTPCAGVCERSFVGNNGHEHPFPTLFTPFADEEGALRYMIGVAVMGGYKSWEIDDMDTVLANTRFDGFRFIDVGYGTPDPIY